MGRTVNVLKLESGNRRRGANTNRGRALVAGGAGFLGSHLCERLLLDGYDVVVLDNFHTGKRYNLNAILRNPRFTCIKHDIVDALPLTENGKVRKFVLRERGVSETTWDRDASGYVLRR